MSDFAALERQLREGLTRQTLVASDQQVQQLLDYLALLLKWNQAYNLTAVRDPAAMVERHLLDSLAILPYIDQTAESTSRWLDVGSGPGLPGIILAIMRPDLGITLLDSNGKKSRFQFQAKVALKLDQVEVVQARVEAYQPEQAFDRIISRAFASLNDFLSLTRHLGHQDSHWLAMKGQYPTDELCQIPDDFTLFAEPRLAVPAILGERYLMCFQHQ
ncbi:16S rRNA (guanine(527)-N(7))-methyltransferase [Terasakiispira papahanaumokuakeensis]|uniref:Ribosomal RNA small subunit methyltransferase G n=1 Tax=Terasakiispira papahanaumokuakeensis TaxID=197479 RepID=A0A1E2VD48_9GAMM|nr:16S rRNA (guanine(527)-N(7))-methyltransferase RsmG [Terasakiispira papahanaumokuakeensis]ODC04782.1 16S rRNA (guanine(527)-N(7))-methyltransferase [Terasakiispira papahanaumokuakeensis]